METKQLKVGDWFKVTQNDGFGYNRVFQILEIRDNIEYWTQHPNPIYPDMRIFYYRDEVEKLTEEEVMLWKLSN